MESRIIFQTAPLPAVLIALLLPVLSIARQRQWAGKHDNSQRVIYYKRGWGRSLSIGAMHRVKDAAELNSLIRTPTAELPPKAKPSTAYPR